MQIKVFDITGEYITDLGETLGWVYLKIPGDITEDFLEKVKDVEVDLIGEVLIYKAPS